MIVCGEVETEIRHRRYFMFPTLVSPLDDASCLWVDLGNRRLSQCLLTVNIETHAPEPNLVHDPLR